MTKRKTYWHLEPLKRKPSEYEIVTSRLLYYPERGFEVNLPIGEWYDQHQRGSPFRCSDWGRFADPRETTYTRYTSLQSEQEIFVDGLLRAIEETGYDSQLLPEWLNVLDRVLPSLRYPCHGLQMVAAYVGQMAPEGRITIAAALQSADEMRRVQRLAYRMRQLQLLRPQFGAQAQAVWEKDSLWQPLRKVIEQLLVTYDWGESFIALNLLLKPAFDELFMTQFAKLAQANGDELLARIFHALNQDCVWHRQWTRALIRMAIDDTPRNRRVIEGWADRWQPEITKAVVAFAPAFGTRTPALRSLDFQAVQSEIELAWCEQLNAALDPPATPHDSPLAA